MPICRYANSLHLLPDFFNISNRDTPNAGELTHFCCATIIDVSPLGNIYKLYLSDCMNITDVSGLGKVHTLHLIRCTKITDVSSLGNVYELDLSFCTGIKDVSALGNVPKLSLAGCCNIEDFSGLGNHLDLNHRESDKAAFNSNSPLSSGGCEGGSGVGIVQHFNYRTNCPFSGFITAYAPLFRWRCALVISDCVNFQFCYHSIGEKA